MQTDTYMYTPVRILKRPQKKTNKKLRRTSPSRDGTTNCTTTCERSREDGKLFRYRREHKRFTKACGLITVQRQVEV